MADFWEGVKKIVVPLAVGSIFLWRPMNQMLLEFGHKNLTILEDFHILSSKSENERTMFVSVPGTLPGVCNLFDSLRGPNMKLQASYTKLRGGYYTPVEISEFLSKWAIRNRTDQVLEPSCGDGVFLESVAHRFADMGSTPNMFSAQIVAFEIDKKEASKAARKLNKNHGAVHVGDFFEGYGSVLKGERFDVVIGNPPFIRYQNFAESQRTRAFDIMRKAGLRPNRLTNAWVPFLVASSLLLKPSGRLAMVIPAELLQVSYASELRMFLSEYFNRIHVLTFRRLAFSDVQQEIVLLLGERSKAATRGQNRIEVVELESANELSQYRQKRFGESGFKSIDHSTEKWTQYFLTRKEIELVREIRKDTRLRSLGEIGDTDIGVVTGINEFFSLSCERAIGLGLQKYSRRLVSRTNHLSGIIFRSKDWESNAARGEKAYLLELPAKGPEHLPESVRAYVSSGESRGFHLGYKCRIRDPWYRVPSIYEPTCFLTRQIHAFPKLTVNEANATSTDTVHRVRFLNGAKPRIVAAAFLNSLTFAFAELLGRSYGGGVLELEPREADRLPMPLVNADKLDTREIDLLVRENKIAEVLTITNKRLLADGLGYSRTDVKAINSIWMKLMKRRVNRRAKAAA